MPFDTKHYKFTMHQPRAVWMKPYVKYGVYRTHLVLQLIRFSLGHVAYGITVGLYEESDYYHLKCFSNVFILHSCVALFMHSLW